MIIKNDDLTDKVNHEKAVLQTFCRCERIVEDLGGVKFIVPYLDVDGEFHERIFKRTWDYNDKGYPIFRECEKDFPVEVEEE